MKILITGGCGFVGSNIAIYLKKRIKKSIICSLDNLMRKGSIINRNRLRNYNIKNFNISIEKFEKIKKLPKFDLVIDCCAEPAIEASKGDPDRVFETNLIGTFNILKKCINDNANIINGDRAYVFGTGAAVEKKVTNSSVSGGMQYGANNTTIDNGYTFGSTNTGRQGGYAFGAGNYSWLQGMLKGRMSN